MNWNFFQYKRYELIESFDDGLYLIIRYLLYTLGLAGLIVVLANAIDIFLIPSLLVTISYFVLSPTLLMVSITFYINYLRTHPEYDITPKRRAENVLNSFDFVALKLIFLLSKSKNWQQFWLSAAKEGGEAEIIYRLGLTPTNLAGLQMSEIAPADLNAITQSTVVLAEGEMVNAYHVLAVLFAIPEVKEVLVSERLDENDISDLLLFYYGADQSSKLALTRREHTGGFGKAWAVSYTNLVDDVTTTITPSEAKLRTLLVPIFSRQRVVDELSTSMLKAAGQNILLVGEPGVGKTELFYHFASRAILYQTKTEIDGKDIRILDVQRLLSFGKSPNELQQIMGSLFNELNRAGDIILFIDQIDQLLEPSGKLGTVDISSLLQGYLQSTSVIVVGTITTERYLKLVKPSAMLSEAFTAVNVPEPEKTELLGILLSHLREIESRYHVFFLLESLKSLCNLSERYIKDQLSPEREISLLEKIAATSHSNKSVIITEDMVTAVVSQQVQVPLQVDETARETLLNLEQQLHKRVIGQNYAIKEVSDALLRARAGLSTGSKPLGSFLFLGPTGVGKTETAKALAAIYFGSEQKMIRLDMSEYADQTSLHKLLGTDAVNDPGSLTMAIQENPSAVMLFDEIEKSNDLVKNALLQLLDEGKITTNYGKVLDFSNTIVISTSNAGSDFIRTQIQSGGTVASFEKPLIDQLIGQKIFLTEFLNRFDGVIVFTPLSKDEIKKVVGLQVALLEAKLQKEKGITLELSQVVTGQLATKGYDPVFGARALQRVMKNELETAIAKEIVSQDPQPGTKLTISSL